MTEKEILENNALIAKFIGSKYGWQDLDYATGGYYIETKYHNSYDYLIPVLEHIESLGYRWEIGQSMCPDINRYHYCRIVGVKTIEGVSPLDAIYGAVITFINWYNEK